MIKKLIALFILFAYLSVAELAYAYSELYYLYNVNPTIAASQVEAVFADKDYSLQKKNPFYAISTKNPERYVTVVMQPTGQDLFYYIEANKKGSSINKAILKRFDNININYQPYYGDMYLSYFAQLAENAKSGTTKTYSFDTPQVYQPTYEQNVQRVNQNPDNALQGYVASIGAGSTLDVYLQNAINTATANVGDSIVAVLKSDWVVQNVIIAPQGSVVYGNLTKAVHARAGMRNGGVVINFNKLVTPEGKSYDIVTQPVDFDVTNEGKLKSTATRMVSAAAMGAVAGLLFALLGGGNYGKSAAIGAGVASGISAVSSVAEKGVDAEIPSYTELEIQVDQNVNVIYSY